MPLGGRFDFEVDWDEQPVGGAAIDADGDAAAGGDARRVQRADAVLLGAVGGPRWDDPSAATRPEDALLGLRSQLGLFANLRPVPCAAALDDASPLRPEVRRGADLLIVRELTGGLYFGRPQGRATDDGVDRRSTRCATRGRRSSASSSSPSSWPPSGRGRLTSVDKANVLARSRLWREVVDEVARRYPDGHGRARAGRLDRVPASSPSRRTSTSS